MARRKAATAAAVWPDASATWPSARCCPGGAIAGHAAWGGASPGGAGAGARRPGRRALDPPVGVGGAHPDRHEPLGEPVEGLGADEEEDVQVVHLVGDAVQE